MHEMGIFVQQHWGLVCGFFGVATLIIILEFKEKVSGSFAIIASEAVDKINHEQTLVVDIREEKEFNKGHIINALNIPAEELDRKQAQLKKQKKKSLILVCASGEKSKVCIKKVEALGLTQCFYLQGGLRHWQDEGMPVINK